MSRQQPQVVIPPAVVVTAMIDTGAAGSVVNPQVIKLLNLSPVGTALIVTPSTLDPLTCDMFSVDLHFPNAVTVADSVVICAPLALQNIQCLIGRDILKSCVLVYVGHLNQFTLSF
jgi:hypothetical protein